MLFLYSCLNIFAAGERGEFQSQCEKKDLVSLTPTAKSLMSVLCLHWHHPVHAGSLRPIGAFLARVHMLGSPCYRGTGKHSLDQVTACAPHFRWCHQKRVTRRPLQSVCYCSLSYRCYQQLQCPVSSCGGQRSSLAEAECFMSCLLLVDIQIDPLASFTGSFSTCTSPVYKRNELYQCCLVRLEGGQKMLSPYVFPVEQSQTLCGYVYPFILRFLISFPLTTFQKSPLVASYTTSSIYTCICVCSVTSVMCNSL